MLTNVKANTSVRCDEGEDRLPAGLPGAIQLDLPCSCKLERDQEMLIPKLFPCDSRISKDPIITHYLPHAWTRLPDLHFNHPADSPLRYPFSEYFRDPQWRMEFNFPSFKVAAWSEQQSLDGKIELLYQFSNADEILSITVLM